MKKESFGIPGIIAKKSRIPPAKNKILGSGKSCLLSCFENVPALESLPALVTIIPADVEIISAGI